MVSAMAWYKIAASDTHVTFGVKISIGNFEHFPESHPIFHGPLKDCKSQITVTVIPLYSESGRI